jgi:hypothetical protein
MIPAMKMLLFRWLCCMAATILPGGPALAGSQPAIGNAAIALPDGDIARQFVAAAARLEGEAKGWEMSVSPAFPEHWPGHSPGRLVFYAYAYRVNPQLADAVEVAGPWARGTLQPGHALQIEILRRSLEPLGIQGVRPMQANEMKLAQRQAQIEALLWAPASAEHSRLIRAFYCNWYGRQGVMAAAIEPRHSAFFRWLQCS